MLIECELESQKSLIERLYSPMYSSQFQLGPKLKMQKQKLPTNA